MIRLDADRCVHFCDGLTRQKLFLTGRVETNSSLPTDQASAPILLKIVPKRTAASR